MKNRRRSALFALLVFIVATIKIAATQSSTYIVTLVDDKQVTHYETQAEDVNELLAQLEITLGEKDIIEPLPDTKIVDNMKITIERWHPTVTVDMNGSVNTQTTETSTVGDFLNSLGIIVNDGDIIQPNKETAITDNLQITIKTREIKKEIEERPMGYTKKVVETKELPDGKTKIYQQGKNGVKQVAIQREYFGGELINEDIIDVVVKVEPVEEITLKGTYSANADNSKNTSSDIMTRINNAAESASAKYNIDKDLILAIVEHESGFQPNVTSSAGAQGLMQVMPSNFSHLGISDGHNIEQNINGGTYLLRKCINLFNGDEKMGLIAYAGGEGTMRQRGVKCFNDVYKMPTGTKNAVLEILEMYEERKNR